MSSRNEDRTKAAEARKTEAAQRTPQDQLARLDSMLGKGVGAKKERAKLAAKMAKPTPAKADAKAAR